MPETGGTKPPVYYAPDLLSRVPPFPEANLLFFLFFLFGKVSLYSQTDLKNQSSCLACPVPEIMGVNRDDHLFVVCFSRHGLPEHPWLS